MPPGLPRDPSKESDDLYGKQAGNMEMEWKKGDEDTSSSGNTQGPNHVYTTKLVQVIIRISSLFSFLTFYNISS